MRVIGTAGHVDHGKSSLVQHLTGIDPDRLAEEKARKLTIDLGFAWMPLDDGEMLGIVDVPGHRDFIENMLAGVGGIDAVILVIAADEGVMPQTREHLAILNLLGIENGLIALSKIDMVDDPEWLALVKQDVRDTVAQTSLADAEIIPVSAHTGAGIPELKLHLNALLHNLPPQVDYKQPRLSVDRVFSISGFGTVVTGTLLGGRLQVGDEVELQPGQIWGRVRGLQSYKQNVNVAYPGSRVAVNISGVDRQNVTRGQLLTHPDQVQPAVLADVYFHYLPDADRPLRHNTAVKVFTGAAESQAHVRLLDQDRIEPGQDGWLQLRLDTPLPLSRGDRYILRLPSPAQTIGGGVVVNPSPRRRWKRFRSEIIHQLETLMQGTPGERIAQAAEGREPIKRSDLQKQTGYSDDELQQGIQEALNTQNLIEIADGLYIATISYHTLQQQILEIVDTFHRMEPLRLGIPREELRSRLNIKQHTLNLLLKTQKEVISDGRLVKRPEHKIRFNQQQQQQLAQLMKQIAASPYTPPSYSEAVDIIGSDVLHSLIETDDIVQIQPEVIFTRPIYDEMVAGTLEIIDQQGKIDAKTLRDRFNTSRKYAIGLLEHLDSMGITRRIGDERVRGKTQIRRTEQT